MTARDIDAQVLTAQRALLDTWRADMRRGAGRVGWKLGYDIPEVETLVGAQPVVGYVTTETLLEDGGTYTGPRTSRLRAETELVIVLRDCVAPDAQAADLENAVAGIATALELVDVSRPADGVIGIIAGNVFHRAVVFGPCVAGRHAGGRPATLAVNATRHNQDVDSRDVVETVRAVARLLDACGEKLLAGDRILSGSLVHTTVRAGDALTAEIDGLGRVRARIAP